MKRLNAIVTLLIAGLAACDTLPEEEIGGLPETKAWWKGLTQEERNAAILRRAEQDVGRYTGQECKEWVRTVIQDASRQAANIPPNCPDKWGWYWCWAPSNAVRLVTSIRNVQPGWIVQMNFRNDEGSQPHTAIVRSRDAGGIWWIDANWRNFDKYALVHHQRFEDFERLTTHRGSSWYSVYLIGGGN